MQKVGFQQTHHQGLHQLLLTVSWDRHTQRCPCLSVVPEATHEASHGPLKGAVLAQKALQGCEKEMRELLGGTTENSVSWVIDLPSNKSMIFHEKVNRKKVS